MIIIICVTSTMTSRLRLGYRAQAWKITPAHRPPRRRYLMATYMYSMYNLSSILTHSHFATSLLLTHPIGHLVSLGQVRLPPSLYRPILIPQRLLSTACYMSFTRVLEGMAGISTTPFQSMAPRGPSIYRRPAPAPPDPRRTMWALQTLRQQWFSQFQVIKLASMSFIKDMAAMASFGAM